MESATCENQVQSLEELLARAVNPELPVNADTIPLWADNTGLLLKGSTVAVDSSSNVTGIHDLTITGTFYGNVVGQITGVADAAYSFLDALA